MRGNSNSSGMGLSNLLRGNSISSGMSGAPLLRRNSSRKMNTGSTEGLLKLVIEEASLQEVSSTDSQDVFYPPEWATPTPPT